jgi:hypothetical protein
MRRKEEDAPKAAVGTNRGEAAEFALLDVQLVLSIVREDGESDEW